MSLTLLALKALVAFKLYKSMGHEAEEDDLEVDVANEVRSCGRLVHSCFVLSTEFLY